MNDHLDAPKLLASAEAREERRSGLNDRHMIALARYVEGLRERHSGRAIPDFDPWDGGTDAEVLFLLEAPGGKAIQSGFVSRNNPDETAKNFFELNSAIGLDRRRTATWNVVPWYVGSGTKIRPVLSSDIAVALSGLNELLPLLPSLRAVVLVGRKAQRVERHLELMGGLPIFRSQHPSPLFVNNKPGNRALVEGQLLEVVRYLDGECGSRGTCVRRDRLPPGL